MADNFLFDLKIKELSLMRKKFAVNNDILVVFEDKPVVLGCRLCYMAEPVPTAQGYDIPGGSLVNLHEKLEGKADIPKELAINCWMCPVCGRIFQELIPQYD